MQPVKINFSFAFLITSILLIFLFNSNVQAQVIGCRDPLANNYNASVTINDGSCTYNTINYTPPVKTDPISDSLVESSGLTMAGNFLWSHNDRGGTATIYRIDTISGAVLQRVVLGGAQNTDWEDIAFDGTYFYIGDFGNNANGARTDLKIYKFPLASIPDYLTNPVATIDSSLIEVINFTYSDQPYPPSPVAANSTKFDCEAMIIEAGKIHLFTKNWIDNNTTHYVINSTTAGAYIAEPLETLNTQFLVTAAAKTSGTNIIALLGYQSSGTGNHFIFLLSGYTGGKYFNGNTRKINLPNAAVMGQAEGITFRNTTYGYISNEQLIIPSLLTVKQKLRSFDTGNFITALSYTYTFTGNGNWTDAANWLNNIVPPASISNGSNIIIDPMINGKCILDIQYTLSPGATLSVNDGKSFLINGNLTVK